MSLRNIASALLMLAAGQVVHGVIYRTIQLNAGLNATLPCHELDEVGDLRMWVTPSRAFIGADFNPDYDKYAIDGTTGSLEVKVSGLLTLKVSRSLIRRRLEHEKSGQRQLPVHHAAERARV